MIQVKLKSQPTYKKAIEHNVIKLNLSMTIALIKALIVIAINTELNLSCLNWCLYKSRPSTPSTGDIN